jgi:hypothetical protein
MQEYYTIEFASIQLKKKSLNNVTFVNLSMQTLIIAKQNLHSLFAS